jgi:predicted TPR repeat methyltransferase
MGQIAPAVQISQEVAERFPEEPSALLSLARALDDADRKDEALAAYRRVLERQPENVEAAFYIQCATGPAPAAPPAELIRDLYDGIADNFDRHLEQKLGYDGPLQMAELLATVLENPDAGVAPPFDILDAGCGTGLAAPRLKPLARSLVGVDLSPKMIRKAQDRGLYDHLHVGDIAAVMRQHPRGIDLILALEVLLYLGDLQGVFQSAAEALRPRGLFALSVEAHEGAGYILQPSRRYAHSRDYLAQLAQAAGFSELACKTTYLRLEHGSPVTCYLLILQRG